MAEPRSSTDEESASLLDHGSPPQRQGFLDKLAAATSETPSFLTKILLGLVLFLLILSSVFIGLFAGAEHRLSKGEGQATVTATHIATQTAVVTVTASPPAPTHTKPAHEKPCLAADCIKLSASILASIDESEDPCEDFYQYANGGWLKENPLPASKSSFGQFQHLQEQNHQIIKEILDDSLTPLTTSPDALSMKKLKDFYASCMDEAGLEKLGQEPLLQFTREIRKVFNGNIMSKSKKDQIAMDDDKDKKATKTGLTAALALLHSRGIPALFWFEVDGDAGVDPDFMTLQFYQEGLGLPAKEYYNETDVVEVYTDVVRRVLYALDESEESEFWPPFPWPPWGGGGDDDDKKKENKTARATRLSKAVVELEKSLADASLDLDILFQDPIGTYNPTPFNNFTEKIPQIHFPAYLSSFAPRNFPHKVIVSYPPYLGSLSDILNSTSAEVLEAYFVSRAGLSLADSLGMTTEVWKASRHLDELLRGLKKGAVEDRQDFCLRRVESALGFASGRFFVERTFSGDSREKAAKVIDDTIIAFKASLPHLGWMDEKSAKAASEKATAIRVKVGYPFSPNTTDAGSVARYYYLVKPDPTRFLDNVLMASYSDQFKKWQKLGKMRNTYEWEMFPSTVNAYFNPPANEIVFPAGILRPPFFSGDWPSYLNYAAFGGVAAHELTHAFDSSGRLYNQRGKLEEWWTNSTSHHFEERKECIAEQYSKYAIDDGKGGTIHVNGNLTSGENIGDAGLIYAYHAWKNQYDESLSAGTEYLLPGLKKFSREQLFFVAWARIWAFAIRPASAVQRVRTDPHSPPKYRVMGTLSNIPEFAAAFNCSSKAKMNPPKKCKLWA
ncbi:hypothetical protein FRC02_001598 [Tulasnella sp. 418]|nr:hypothetical protein FRC02_001598 [Tulasnella sp. 418]